MKQIGLYFGSFNPIHNGHLALGHYFLENTPLEEICFIISPQSPFKFNQSLLAEKNRCELVRIAIDKLEGFSYSTIEFELPKPNYTYDTIRHFIKKQPSDKFTLLMGEDNLAFFNQWKNYKEILDLVPLYIYPRTDSEAVPKFFSNHPKIKLFNGPKFDIDSTEIRSRLSKGQPIGEFVPDAVVEEIQNNNYYQ